MSGQGALERAVLTGTPVASGPSSVGRSRRREDGASAVEYGLLIAGIAAIIVLAVFTMGDTVIKMFDGTCGEFDSQSTVSTTC